MIRFSAKTLKENDPKRMCACGHHLGWHEMHDVGKGGHNYDAGKCARCKCEEFEWPDGKDQT